jgi:hypothetical protein
VNVEISSSCECGGHAASVSDYFFFFMDISTLEDGTTALSRNA